MIIVTRWPSAVEAIIANQNFVKRLKDANVIQEQLRESRQIDDGFISSAEGKRIQTKFDVYLEDPYIKRLIYATDLIKLLKQMTDIEIEAISYYPYLTQSTTVIPKGKTIVMSDKLIRLLKKLFAKLIRNTDTLRLFISFDLVIYIHCERLLSLRGCRCVSDLQHRVEANSWVSAWSGSFHNPLLDCESCGCQIYMS